MNVLFRGAERIHTCKVFRLARHCFERNVELLFVHIADNYYLKRRKCDAVGRYDNADLQVIVVLVQRIDCTPRSAFRVYG